jgi:glycosyltransferase involved in cell wall biosynthesis
MDPTRHDGRFAFVTLGPFSGINAAVLAQLRTRFPDYQAEHLDIAVWVRRRPAIMLVNLIRLLATHGPSIFTDRTRLWGAFYRSPYMFRAIRRAMKQRLGRGGYAFSFQTQSLFDASVPGIPHFVYTDHTELVNRSYPDYDAVGAATDQWLELERSIYANADLIFTMSSHVSRSLTEEYSVDPSRVSCVLAGSNVGSADRTGADVEPEYAGKRILFVGRQWERKGGPDLIGAFRLVRKRDPDASLVIVGNAPELELEGVERLGELPPEDVAEQYARAAVFCMPSLIEPFGIVFVEALSRGLPVVATSIGALPDLVQDGQTGYLHQPHDLVGLSESLCRLLADPELCRRFGGRGRAFARERYTWEHAVGSIAKQIRSTTGSGQPAISRHAE